jgi:uncharacterized surface protein with fasciclin (FAS1) repeats
VIKQASGRKTIRENLAANRDLSTLAGAVKAACLDNVLDGPAAYTLFAPDNKAFRKQRDEPIGALLQGRDKLAGLARCHVVPGKVAYADLAMLPEIRTVSGKTLPVDRHGREIIVGGARVLGPGIESNNGIIYRVDKVITPPGFAISHASTARGTRRGLLNWVAGAITLGGIAYYLLARKKAYQEPGTAIEPTEAIHEEKPFAEMIGAKIMAKPRLEVKAGVVKMRRSGEPAKWARGAVPSHGGRVRADIVKTLSLPLAGDAYKGLKMLIENGKVSDKPELIALLVKTYRQNDISTLMSEGVEPHETRIMDIVHKTGIARGLFDTDIKKFLVPLFLAGFVAIHEQEKRKTAAKAM